MFTTKVYELYELICTFKYMDLMNYSYAPYKFPKLLPIETSKKPEPQHV